MLLINCFSCTQAIILNPKREFAEYNKGFLLHQLGKYDEAID